jgi:hypothetical protein
MKFRTMLITFLKMLREDVIRFTRKKYNSSSVLPGQTLTRSEVYSQPSLKLMKDEERVVVDSILDNSDQATKEINPSAVDGISNQSGRETGKYLVKAIPGMGSNEQAQDFKEAA